MDFFRGINQKENIDEQSEESQVKNEREEIVLFSFESDKLFVIFLSVNCRQEETTRLIYFERYLRNDKVN